MTRIGVIGTGAIAQVHLDAWAQLPVELVGYYDVDQAAAERAMAKYGGRAFPTLDALLERGRHGRHLHAGHGAQGTRAGGGGRGQGRHLRKAVGPFAGRLRRDGGRVRGGWGAALSGPRGALLSPVCPGQRGAGQRRWAIRA
ncbi:MAG: Gfo/Idh/MocA family oxidoreductase [Caldilineaceae bacterium]